MKYTFEEVEDYLNQQRSIKIENVLVLKGENLLDKMKDFFTQHQSKRTIYEDNSFNCHAYARRSIGDIYIILRYYMPEIRLKEVYELLIELIKQKFINSFVCTDIHKRIFRKPLDSYLFNYFKDYPLDEFGFNYPYELWTTVGSYGCSPRCITERGLKDEFEKLNLNIQKHEKVNQ